jgi:hypothetical protein
LAKTYTIQVNLVLGGSLAALDLLNAHGSTQRISGHAAGTSYAPPGMYMAGENGPELIYSRTATGVMNNQQTRTYMGRSTVGASSGPIQIVISAGANLPGALLDQLRFEVDTNYAGSAQAAFSRRRG